MKESSRGTNEGMDKGEKRRGEERGGTNEGMDKGEKRGVERDK